MSRYIDVDAVVWEIEKDKCGLEDYDSALDVAIAEIKTFKAADVVEVVHGEWVVCDAPPPTWWYECSICHKAGNVEYNYCPNCGAEMRGGNDDSEMCTIGKGKETMSDDPDMSCQAY